MNMQERVLVTGGSGFVGSALIHRLAGQGVEVTAPVRRVCPGLPDSVQQPVINGIDPDTNWSAALTGIDCVVHAAARVHVMSETAADPLAEFRAVNVAGTLNLARQAAAAGVRRFVFISSIKVNGEQTDDRPPFAPGDTPAPEDPYGMSKHEAEAGLRELAAETGMELVIIRPPLVYGPGVKGNFRSLLKLAGLPVPLPLGGIRNRRSLVFLGNLVDFIVHAAQHPAAANQTFLVSDGHDLSTTELLSRMRKALGRPGWLLPIPGQWLWGAARVAGKGGIGQRLCGSLGLDTSLNESLLGWNPPYTVEQGLAETVSGLSREKN